jgi:NAD(P)-dependent dehydrogenase (short-subunit alcohol dehydrogenase family)
VPGRIVLVTGANRGLGHEVARQLAARGDTVLLGSRDPAKGERAAADIGAHAVPLDVTDRATIDAVAADVAARHGRLDVLVNNAGVDYDTWETAAGADFTVVREALETNLLGAWQTTVALVPMLRRGRTGASSTCRRRADRWPSWAPGHRRTASRRPPSTR